MHLHIHQIMFLYDKYFHIECTEEENIVKYIRVSMETKNLVSRTKQLRKNYKKLYECYS